MDDRYFAGSRRIVGMMFLILTIVLGLVPAALAADGEGQLITFSVPTPNYELSEQGVSVPGYELSQVPGAPQLPVSTTLVDLPLEGTWQVSYEILDSQLLDGPADFPAAPVPQWTVKRLLDPSQWPSAVPVVDQPDPDIYGADAFYPPAPVIWGEAIRQGNKRMVPVQVYPFQVNPQTGKLRYSPSVRVQIRVTESEVPQQAPVSSPGDLYEPKGSSLIANAAGAVRIHTGQPGMYRLTYDDLANAGVAVGPGGEDPSTFAVVYEGQPVAIKVTGAGDGSFDPGDLVIFYAQPYTKRWQDYNVYWFLYGGDASPSMAQRSEVVTGQEPVVTTIYQTEHVEYDGRGYISITTRSVDEDHWTDTFLYVDGVYGPQTASTTYTFALDDYQDGSDVVLRALFHRANRQRSALPDNSLALYVNTQYLGTYQWNSISDVEYYVDTVVPGAWILPSTGQVSTNEVTIEADASQLPDLQWYQSAPDWVAITYPALADAEGDSLYVEAVDLQPGLNEIRATGFSTSSVSVYDLRDPRYPVELATKQAVPGPGGYTLSFWDSDLPQPSYYVSTDAGLASPFLVEADSPSDWGKPNHDVDYIAIVPSSVQHGQLALDLAAAVQPLLAFRQTPAGGDFSVAQVNLQDIFDEWSYGRVDPEAIRSFLGYAYWNWATPPQYVLLVGDATYDFTDVSGTTLRNLIPPYLGGLPDPYRGEVPADSRYVSVDGPDDLLPNMAIGRISAQSVAEVTNVVSKTLAYEAGTAPEPTGWQDRVVFTTGRCNDVTAGNLHLRSNLMREWLPEAYDDVTVYFGDPSQCPEGNTADSSTWNLLTRQQFDGGALFLQWLGHGNELVWGGGPTMRSSHLDLLQPNTVWPITAQYACNTGYFTYIGNNKQSLAEDFLQKHGDRGSVADVSGAGLHTASDMVLFGRGMVQAIFLEHGDRIGDAVSRAKELFWGYLHPTEGDDVIDTMTLFGDPALRIRFPDGGSSISQYTFQSTPEWVPPGQETTHALDLTNGTADLAPGVQVSITLPSQLGAPQWMSSTVSTMTYQAPQHQITWQGDVSAGQTVTLSFGSLVSNTLSACTQVLVSGEMVDGPGALPRFFQDSVRLAVPDVNCSGRVDIVDVQQVAGRWNTAPGDPLFHPRYDLSGDGMITVDDILVASQVWNP